MRKSQSAIEFLSLTSVMLLVVVGFFAVTNSKILESQEEGVRKTAEDIAGFAYSEIEIARSTQDGYVRLFTMPETVNGVVYTIEIADAKELIVNYQGYEYVKFLPSNVTGNISRGLNKIIKEEGIVNVNSFKIILPPSLLVMLMKDPSNNAISFDDQGNVTLRGALQQNQAAITPTPSDEFIFRDSSGANVAMINLNTGDMYIKGSLFERQSSLNPTGNNNLIIKDNEDNVASFIDNNGNFYLKGKLKQNSNP